MGIEIGEKYLSISILGSVKTAAFKNKHKEKPTDPDYRGDGVAVWVNEKKSSEEVKVERVDNI